MGTFKETLENITAIREGFDKTSVAHHAVKSVSGAIGKKTYHADGSATISTSSKGKVSSTSLADHSLRKLGHMHNFSEKDLRNHTQNHEHPKHGKYHVNVQGSNAKGHTVTVKAGHKKGIGPGQYSSQL